MGVGVGGGVRGGCVRGGAYRVGGGGGYLQRKRTKRAVRGRVHFTQLSEKGGMGHFQSSRSF